MATRYSTTVSESMMYVALRTGGDTGQVGYVRVALPLTKVEEQSTWLVGVVGGAAP